MDSRESGNGNSSPHPLDEVVTRMLENAGVAESCRICPYLRSAAYLLLTSAFEEANGQSSDPLSNKYVSMNTGVAKDKIYNFPRGCSGSGQHGKCNSPRIVGNFN